MPLDLNTIVAYKRHIDDYHVGKTSCTEYKEHTPEFLHFLSLICKNKNLYMPCYFCNESANSVRISVANNAPVKFCADINLNQKFGKELGSQITSLSNPTLPDVRAAILNEVGTSITEFE